MKAKEKLKPLNILLWTIFLLSLVVPRFIQIERPITVDELTWLTFSSDFYYGVVRGDMDRTYQDHHPGVTTMWAGTAAYLIEDPGYRGQGQGYMENDTFKLIDFLAERDVDIFDILVTARRLMAAACIAVLILSAIFLWRLFPPLPAFLVMMFVSFDPMIVGQTRLFSHEGLMSVLVFLSWLSFFDYYQRGRQWGSLLISGLAAGLAVSTKITALGLVPLIGIFWLVDFLKTIPEKECLSVFSHLWQSLRPILVWVTILFGSFMLIWPASWKNPVATITYMINHTRGFGGGASTVDLAHISQNLVDYLSGIWAHPTLLTWAGILFFLVALFFPRRFKQSQHQLDLGTYSFIFILVVYLTVSILVTSIRGIRYMTSAQIFLAMIGGIGFGFLIHWLKSERFQRYKQWVIYLLVFVLVVSQAVIISPAAPYYYTHNHPLRINPWWDAHGAFLDQAGDYLAEKPNAEELTAMTFSPGSMMFFWPGKTNMIVPIPQWIERDVERLEQSDYLVIDATLRNLDHPPRVIDDIDNAGVLPEHTVEFQNRTFVWIYKVSDLPPEAFIPDPAE